jgi:hypothetical protein
MGQTDVASLLYADDANALSFTPNGLQRWITSTPGSTNGMREFHQKQGDGISP